MTLLKEIKTIVAKNTERPSWDDYFIANAVLLSSRSPCERLHVGCIMVSQDNRILATGYNGFIAGSAHKSRMKDGHEQATVHAEQNAISDAAKRGVRLEGATAYITHYPCINCTKIMVASGIKKIIYADDYKNEPISTEILEDAGIIFRKV